MIWWIAAYLAVPAVVHLLIYLDDRRDTDKTNLTRTDRITIVVASLLWPIAAVAIVRGWWSDRRKRRNQRIRKDPPAPRGGQTDG